MALPAIAMRAGFVLAFLLCAGTGRHSEPTVALC